MKYQRSLNPELNGSAWSRSEDSALRAAVMRTQSHNWQHVSMYLPNRTCSQCMHRWEKVLRPGIRKGIWTVQEDVELLTWAEVSVLPSLHIHQHIDAHVLPCRL